MENQHQDRFESPRQTHVADPAQMSEVGTLAGIFFEPGRVFEDLRRKPRFILAMILIALSVTAYSLALNYKVGEAGIRKVIVEQLDKSPQMQSASKEDKQKAIDMQMSIQGVVKYTVPVFVVIIILLGSLLYFLGVKAFGGSGGFLHALSVFAYSMLPPTLVSMIGSLIVLAFKSADDIDLMASQRGTLQANLGVLVDSTANPVLSTLLSVFDLFAIWGWVLAAIGLRIVNRFSSGTAWAIVLIFAVIGALFRVLMAALTGAPS